MSATVKSVVVRLEELLVALGKLFASKSLETLVSLVARLGIDGILKRGAQLLQQALNRAFAWLEELRVDLSQTDALRGLIGVLTPMLRGVDELSSAAASGLDKLGLGSLEPVVAPAETFASVGQQVLNSADRVLHQLPTATQIAGLKQRVTDILGSVGELRSEIERAALAQITTPNTGEQP